MTDRSIVFCGEMVRALIAGRKTQTRRLAQTKSGDDAIWQTVLPGHRLWVKESITRFDKGTCDQHCWYRAGCNGEPFLFSTQAAAAAGKSGGEWPLLEGPSTGAPYNMSPRYMPKMFSRLTLVVVRNAPQRLQDISVDDATAEGWPHAASGGKDVRLRDAYPIGWFANRWNDLHGPNAWDKNPEVIALTFTVHHVNIDDMPAAREAA